MLKTVSNTGGGTTGGVVYQGTWNASTNTPTLTSGSGTKGYYYVVSVAGSTNLDGETLWGVGDWAVFNGTIWQKVDGGDTGNVTSITVTSLTGYMYANNTSPVTASLTIPNSGLSNSSAIIGNTTVTLGSTVTSLGNVTLTNTTISSVASTFPNNFLSNSSATLGNATITLGSTTSNVGNLTLANVIIQSGTFPSGNLSSNSATIGNTVVALGSTVSTLGNVTLANPTLTNATVSSVGVTFPNNFLSNSSATIGNTAVTLGSTVSSLGNVTMANVTITTGTINVTSTNHAATTAASATFSNSSMMLVPAGYIDFDLNGTVVKVPYYAV